ncbi:MAG TPA: MHYT domain-containing protein, partial [Acetobacteraceae bacterium]|nr:MHYT domain-containing protein [Acetobacteraceae bacterium]
MVVTGTYNAFLVALSILVASLASYTALDLSGHVPAARGVARHIWLVAAAIAMGGGIWSMHFIGMLAFVMPIPVSYDIGPTAVSLLVAIIVTGGAFHVLSRRSASPRHLVFSGIFMGLGIAAMHYTGMAAMRGHALLSYDPLFVALSLVIAIGASTGALWLAFRTTDLWQKLAAAVLMGLAVSGMHYTGMRAAVFVAQGTVHEARSDAAFDQSSLALAIAGITFVILIMAWIASLFERNRAEESLRQAQADLARVNRVTTLGELTASLSHELNQPISAVVASANACVRWLAGDPPNLEMARAAAKRMVRDGTRAADIITRTRLLFTKDMTPRESVDINEIIREMTVLLRSEAMRHAVSVRAELATDLPHV